jgi:hypothetical protein
MKKHLKDVVDLKNHLDQFDWRENEKSDNLITNDFELSYKPKLTIVTEAGAKFYGLMPSVQIRDIKTNEIFYRWDTSTIAECSIFLKWYEETRAKANRENSTLRSNNRSLALDKFFDNQSERSDY